MPYPATAVVPSRRATSRGPAIAARPEPRGRAFTKAGVAELSLADVYSLSDDDLANVIRTAHVPLFRVDTIDRLPFFDRNTLEHLAFLARRTVRNQGY